MFSWLYASFCQDEQHERSSIVNKFEKTKYQDKIPIMLQSQKRRRKNEVFRFFINILVSRYDIVCYGQRAAILENLPNR